MRSMSAMSDIRLKSWIGRKPLIALGPQLAGRTRAASAPPIVQGTITLITGMSLFTYKVDQCVATQMMG
jgi:hypothetical protein